MQSVSETLFEGVDINTLKRGQNGRDYADDILNAFLNKNCRSMLKISLTFVCNIPVDNITTYQC